MDSLSRSIFNPRRTGLVIAILAATAAVFPGVSKAEIQSQEGCVEWNSQSGCIVRQYCTLNTKTKYWACIYWDSRDGSVEVAEGNY